MIDSILQRQLGPVIRRREGIRRWRIRVGIFLAIAVTAGIAVWLSNGSAWWLCLPLFGGLAAWGIGRMAARRPLVDLHELAAEIEEDNPELQGLLLTAIGEEERNENKELGFLQERLIIDASREAIASGWGESIDARRDQSWRLGSVVAAVVMGVALFSLIFSTGRSYLPGFSGDERLKEVKGAAFTVEPGDVELERGARLVVTIRFGDQLPVGATLETMLGGTGKSIPMKQSLSDPIFVAAVPEVEADGTYKVVFEGGSSEEFAVTTYSLPALESVDAVVTAPPGSGLSIKEIEDTRRITVLEGSKVKLLIQTKGEVVSGDLTWVGDDDESPENIPSSFGF